jgi:hypothetical protein
MYPKYHIILGGLVTILIYLISQITLFQAVIIFLSSFLIDFDHYIIYAIKKKDLSLKNARNYFYEKKDLWLNASKEQRKNFKHLVIIFHGIEFWVILIILAQFHTIFYFILTGIIIHMFLDYIDMIHLSAPFYTKFSQIKVYLRNKKNT